MGLDVLLENQLGQWPKLQKFHIHSLSTGVGVGWGVEIEPQFLRYESIEQQQQFEQQFLRYGSIFKIATFGHETWAEVAHTS